MLVLQWEKEIGGIMRKVVLVSVTESCQIELTPEIQSQLRLGDEYLVWVAENTLMFKKVKPSLNLIWKDPILKVMEEGKLELPPKIQEKLKPNDEYIISVMENLIMFYKIALPVTFDELFRRQEELATERDQPSLEEISEMVKEVRRERRLNK
jgi:RecB family endonuclease NucS